MACARRRIRGEPRAWSGRRRRHRPRRTSSSRRSCSRKPTIIPTRRHPLPEAAASPFHSQMKHQFETLAQQHHADTLGMWVFLGTEVLFFGGLITAYVLYRSAYSAAFAHASLTLDIVSGTIMTMVLLGSSLTMAMA